VTINRPDRMNALGADTLVELADTIEKAADARVIVLTGTGRGFSTGADLLDIEQGETPGARTMDAANRVTRVIREVPVPVVTAVNGPAAGVGAAFALAGDIIIARQSAYFLLSFANVGLMPDGGASALLPAAIGRVRASRMALLAERIPAPLAEQWGLITFVVPDDEFDAEVNKIADRLAAGPGAAYARMKHAVNTTTLSALETAFALEREGQLSLMAHPDFAEGVAAFVGKRAPKFQ
jgi:enoyl-CoA hydratase/carnithine racemase